MAGHLCSAKRNAPFFMVMLGISSNHTMRGNNSSSTCGCVVTGKFTRHGCAPPTRFFWQGPTPKFAGCLLCRLSATQVVLCWHDWWHHSLHDASLLHLSWMFMSRTRLGVMRMCSLGAMQPGHGHSKCSHLEGARWLGQSLVLKGRRSKWEGGRTCHRAESSYRSTRNHLT